MACSMDVVRRAMLAAHSLAPFWEYERSQNTFFEEGENRERRTLQPRSLSIVRILGEEFTSTTLSSPPEDADDQSEPTNSPLGSFDHRGGGSISTSHHFDDDHDVLFTHMVQGGESISDAGGGTFAKQHSSINSQSHGENSFSLVDQQHAGDAFRAPYLTEVSLDQSLPVPPSLSVSLSSSTRPSSDDTSNNSNNTEHTASFPPDTTTLPQPLSSATTLEEIFPVSRKVCIAMEDTVAMLPTLDDLAKRQVPRPLVSRHDFIVSVQVSEIGGYVLDSTTVEDSMDKLRKEGEQPYGVEEEKWVDVRLGLSPDVDMALNTLNPEQFQQAVQHQHAATGTSNVDKPSIPAFEKMVLAVTLPSSSETVIAAEEDAAASQEEVITPSCADLFLGVSGFTHHRQSVDVERAILHIPSQSCHRRESIVDKILPKSLGCSVSYHVPEPAADNGSSRSFLEIEVDTLNCSSALCRSQHQQQQQQEQLSHSINAAIIQLTTSGIHSHPTPPTLSGGQLPPGDVSTSLADTTQLLTPTMSTSASSVGSAASRRFRAPIALAPALPPVEPTVLSLSGLSSSPPSDGQEWIFPAAHVQPQTMSPNPTVSITDASLQPLPPILHPPTYSTDGKKLLSTSGNNNHTAAVGSIVEIMDISMKMAKEDAKGTSNNNANANNNNKAGASGNASTLRRQSLINSSMRKPFSQKSSETPFFLFGDFAITEDNIYGEKTETHKILPTVFNPVDMFIADMLSVPEGSLSGAKSIKSPPPPPQLSTTNAHEVLSTSSKRMTIPIVDLDDETDDKEEADDDTFAWGDFTVGKKSIQTTSSSSSNELDSSRRKDKTGPTFLFGDFEVYIPQERTNNTKQKSETQGKAKVPVDYDKLRGTIRNYSMSSFGQGKSERIKCIAIDHSETVFSVCSTADVTADLKDLETGDLIHTCTGPRESITHMAFSPDGKYFAIAVRDGTLALYDVATGKLYCVCEHPKAVTCVTFSSNGKFVLSGCQDRGARMWMVRGRGKKTPTCTFLEHSSYVTCADFQPWTDKIVTGAGDTNVFIWSAVTGGIAALCTGHSGQILSVGFDRDGERLFSNDMHDVRIWNANNGTTLIVISKKDVLNPRVRPAEPIEFFTMCAFAPLAFSNMLCVCTSEGSCHIYNLEELVKTCNGGGSSMRLKSVVTDVIPQPYLTIHFSTRIVALVAGQKKTMIFGDLHGNVQKVIFHGYSEETLKPYQQSRGLSTSNPNLMPGGQKSSKSSGKKVTVQSFK